MDCKTFDIRLSEFLFGEMDPKHLGTWTEHGRSCKKCQKNYRATIRVGRLLGKLFGRNNKD